MNDYVTHCKSANHQAILTATVTHDDQALPVISILQMVICTFSQISSHYMISNKIINKNNFDQQKVQLSIHSLHKQFQYNQQFSYNGCESS